MDLDVSLTPMSASEVESRLQQLRDTYGMSDQEAIEACKSGGFPAHFSEWMTLLEVSGPPPIKDENQPYITVMHGVGVFQAVIMKWSNKQQEYCMGPLGKARKTAIQAQADAERIAKAKGLEIR